MAKGSRVKVNEADVVAGIVRTPRLIGVAHKSVAT